jgi:hypothetical protein
MKTVFALVTAASNVFNLIVLTVLAMMRDNVWRSVLKISLLKMENVLVNILIYKKKFDGQFKI